MIIKYLCNVVYYFEMQYGTIIDFIWYKKRNLDPSTVTLLKEYFKWGRTQVLEIQIQIENIVNFLRSSLKKKILTNSVQYPELFMNFAPCNCNHFEFLYWSAKFLTNSGHSRKFSEINFKSYMHEIYMAPRVKLKHS